MDYKYAVAQSSGAHNFYWVSIVHTILPFPRPPQTTKNKNNNKLFHVQIINTPVGCQMYRRIRRIEIQNPNCVVERVPWSVTEVSEGTGWGLNAGSILKSAAGGEIDNRLRINQPHSQAPPE
jgi:hypothetical protein